MPHPCAHTHYFETLSNEEVSRRRVKNFILWKLATKEFIDASNDNARLVLDRYNLTKDIQGLMASQIKNTRTLGYYFVHTERGHSPPRHRSPDRRLIPKMPYHDDSPTRNTIESLGLDITKKIGRGKRNKQELHSIVVGISDLPHKADAHIRLHQPQIPETPGTSRTVVLPHTNALGTVSKASLPHFIHVVPH